MKFFQVICFLLASVGYTSSINYDSGSYDGKSSLHFNVGDFGADDEAYNAYDYKSRMKPYAFLYETPDETGGYVFHAEVRDENGHFQESHGYVDSQGRPKQVWICGYNANARGIMDNVMVRIHGKNVPADFNKCFEISYTGLPEEHDHFSGHGFGHHDFTTKSGIVHAIKKGNYGGLGNGKTFNFHGGAKNTGTAFTHNKRGFGIGIDADANTKQAGLRSNIEADFYNKKNGKHDVSGNIKNRIGTGSHSTGEPFKIFESHGVVQGFGYNSRLTGGHGSRGSDKKFATDKTGHSVGSNFLVRVPRNLSYKKGY